MPQTVRLGMQKRINMMLILSYLHHRGRLSKLIWTIIKIITALRAVKNSSFLQATYCNRAQGPRWGMPEKMATVLTVVSLGYKGRLLPDPSLLTWIIIKAITALYAVKTSKFSQASCHNRVQDPHWGMAERMAMVIAVTRVCCAFKVDPDIPTWELAKILFQFTAIIERKIRAPLTFNSERAQRIHELEQQIQADAKRTQRIEHTFNSIFTTLKRLRHRFYTERGKQIDALWQSFSEPQRKTIIEAADSRLICPITKELLREPVVPADGRHYERYALQQWYDAYGQSCPYDRTKILTIPTELPVDAKSQVRILIFLKEQQHTVTAVVPQIWDKTGSALKSLS